MLVEIDDALVAEAMAVTGAISERAVAEEALRVLIRHQRELRTMDLDGTVDWRGDLDASRRGRGDTT